VTHVHVPLAFNAHPATSFSLSSTSLEQPEDSAVLCVLWPCAEKLAAILPCAVLCVSCRVLSYLLAPSA
jgi:hypothetical protein